MKRPFGIIYKATNTLNNMMYIGQTVKTLNGRRNAHKSDVKYNRYNSYFHKEIKKYGWDNFTWEIVCECDTRKELNESEVFYIKKLNTLKPLGYNLTIGGDGCSGRIILESTKRKISDAKRGRKFSDEHKQNLSKSHIGQSPWNKGKTGFVVSDETKEKISNTSKGRISPMKGRHQSEESKEKIRVSMKKIREKERNEKYS
jgi:group I intron endonuclease